MNRKTFQEKTELRREEHELKSPDILALKGLAQFEKFPASKLLGLLETGMFQIFISNKPGARENRGMQSIFQKKEKIWH
jgi:hypothetical protein